MDKPNKELKAFTKTKLLQPGEEQIVKLTWNTMDMSSFNEKNSSWELAKGDYIWSVSSSSVDVKDSVTKKIGKKEIIKVHNAMRPSVKW